MVADILLWVSAVTLVLIGLAGTLVPVLPGTPLVCVGLVLAAWIDRFGKVGWMPLVVIGVLAAISLVIDFYTTARGAQKAGATKLALIGAAVGMTIGLFFGLPGLIAGPFLGAAAGQLIGGGGLAAAGKVGLGTWTGIIAGSIAKLAIGVVMVVIFAVAYFV